MISIGLGILGNANADNDDDDDVVVVVVQCTSLLQFLLVEDGKNVPFDAADKWKSVNNNAMVYAIIFSFLHETININSRTSWR